MMTLVGIGSYVVNRVIQTRSGVQAAAGIQAGVQAIGYSPFAGGAAVSAPGLPTADLGTRMLNFMKSIGDFIAENLTTVGKVAVKNALGQYLGNLARYTAEWIAEGGKGKSPLIQLKEFGAYLDDQEAAAYAEFFDTLGSKYGVDVCNPSLDAKLVIHYGLGLKQTRPQNPRCSLQQIQDNWAALAPDQKTFLSRFSAALEADQNDLGIALGREGKLLADKNKKREQSILDRLEGQGAKALTTLNKLIKTPPFAVRLQVGKILDLGTSKELAFIGDPIADAVGIFVNTLGSKLQDKWLKKGLVNLADVYSQAGSTSGLFGGLGTLSRAEPRFAALAKVDLGTPGTVDVLSELSNCSDETRSGFGNQCVIESAFRQAIEQRMTVQEATAQDLLHSDWIFGYTADGKELSINSGYPYSSMVILRTKRILPVGWELAAQAAKALSKSYTLQQILNCYEDPSNPAENTKPVACQIPTGNTVINPFWHLVDPNWVLKVPLTRCVSRGASAELLSETFVCSTDFFVDCVEETSGLNDTIPTWDEPQRIIQRADYCADEQSCVLENGNSCGAWGYCFEEKPIFSLGDQQCPEQFASCVGVTTPSGQNTAYRKNSLEMCSSAAAGCRWYSTRSSSDGAYETRNSDRLYLNNQARDCDPEDAGCRKLLRFGIQWRF